MNLCSMYIELAQFIESLIAFANEVNLSIASAFRVRDLLIVVVGLCQGLTVLLLTGPFPCVCRGVGGAGPLRGE